MTFIALVLALIPGGKYAVFSSITAFLASFLMLLAFAIDIALLAKVKSAYHVPGSSTHAGPGKLYTLVLLEWVLRRPRILAHVCELHLPLRVGMHYLVWAPTGRGRRL